MAFNQTHRRDRGSYMREVFRFHLFLSFFDVIFTQNQRKVSLQQPYGEIVEDFYKKSSKEATNRSTMTPREKNQESMERVEPSLRWRVS